MFKLFPRISTTRLVLGLTAIIVGYFRVTGATTALRSSRLGDREDRLRVEISEFQERFDRLEALREYLNTDEYIEAVAREQLGLVREGETGIVVISAAPSPPPDSEGAQESELWWETLIR